MRVLLLALLLVGCAEATQSAGTDTTEDLATPEADLLVPAPPDLSGVLFDIPAASRKVGEECQADSDCISSLCKPVLPGGGAICVASCTKQSDCAGFINMFCEAISVDGTDGYCIPRSSAHCASCAADSECGGLTERCLTGPGDIAPACHIDCSLGGAAACPDDYNCEDVMDQGKARKLCRPKNQVCLDALGGFCDRIGLPQPCSRANASGTCSGQRTCLALRRYDKCGAQAPMYKMSCTELDPAGCKLQLAPGVTTTPQNCGACGNACPGLGLSNNDVQCVDPATKKCGMSCRGENYDVDGNATNGCEQLDAVPPGHTEATAASRGSKDCFDGASTDNFSSRVLSDARAHANPTVSSFSGTVGAAPDYWVVNADGGTFCVNDYDVTITTSGGGGAACYRLNIKTNKKSDSVVVSGSGTANMSSGSGSYSGGGQIYFWVEKICNLPVQEAVTYTVKYHL